MPVPIIEECEHALSSAFSARTRILDVIQGILDYADADTWEGAQATTWLTELEGYTAAARTSLGDPFDEAVEDCRAEARRLQSATMTAAGT